MTFITLAIIILCLGSGSAMIYAGIYHGNRMRKRGVEWTKAQGEITDLGFESSGESTRYKFTIKYNLGKTDYYFETTQNSSGGMDIGKNVDILVNPNMPSEAVLKGGWLFMLCMIGVTLAGGMFLVLGFIMAAEEFGG